MVWKVLSDSEEIMECAQAVNSQGIEINMSGATERLFGGHFGLVVGSRQGPAVEELGGAGVPPTRD